jgi:hypothetical protein
VELSSLRDLVLVIWGLIASIAIIYFCIITGILFRRLNIFLSSLNTASVKVKEIAEKVQEEVFTPLSQIGSFLRSINQGISFINKLFNKKED